MAVLEKLRSNPGRVQPGDWISERYRLLRLLDVGGMGEVWAAKNELTQRKFAIKFMLPTLAEQPEALERFVREAETTGKLQHPSIVDVYDVALAEDGRPYIVMELLSGESLEARLERDGTLSPLRTAAYLSQVAQGLALAHAAGVVHRDLSTPNVYLARNPEGGEPIPKILDFGVSKTLEADGMRTGAGAVLGCPDYMSPEQARGAELVDARTDLWSLGVIMYQCLTGTVPFRAKNYNALMVAILTRPHRPIGELLPMLDSELAEIAEACLKKEREARIQTAEELGQRLGAVARRLDALSVRGGRTPRRRATDRLPLGPKADSIPREALSWPSRGARAVGRLRPPRKVVGLVSAVIGAAAGAAAAGALGSSDSPPSPAPVSAPEAFRTGSVSGAEPASAKRPVVPRADAPASRVETDLPRAVARSLGVDLEKRRRRSR